MKMQTDLITALYARFSHDDNVSGDSNSVANQKKLLLEYANLHGFGNCRFYVDDGISGVTFDRPAFSQMLEDIEQGLVGTVIVKDMSRLGRNYLLVGQYTELIFPEYNVRFISVCENVDSAEGLSDMLPFHNIMNEWYARDISKKIRAVFNQRNASGERLTTKAIYGYKKDPNDKTKWIIDEPAAEIVRQIFAMFLNGHSPTEIAETLMKSGVKKPTVHMGVNVGTRKAVYSTEFSWSVSTIIQFLKKPEYCGDTVNRRTRRGSFKSKKVILTSPDEWYIFPNTHPAIISREDFNAVQEKLSAPHRRKPVRRTAFFYDLIFCADCGAKMYALRRNDSEICHSVCSTFRKANAVCKHSCSSHYISETVLKDLVLREIQKFFLFAHTDSKKFEMFLKNRIDSTEEQTAAAITSEISKKRERLAEIDRYVQGLFESKVRGEIDAEFFGNLSAKYRTEKEELKADIEKLVQKESKIEDLSKKAVTLGTRVHKFDTISELTPEILRDFVERIEVEEKSTSRRVPDKNRKIKVFFYGIGLIDLD